MLNIQKKYLKICTNNQFHLKYLRDDYISMKHQALIINSWGKNVYVKVPVLNSKGKFMGKIN